MSLCFLIHVFDETPRQVQTLLDKLADVYPNADKLLLEDGVPQKTFKGCTKLAHEQRLKVPAHGGAWTHRYLENFLKGSTATHLIKLDPDTKVVSELTGLPDGLAIFGAIGEIKTPRGVDRMPHGGALGFTRSAVQWLVSTKVFLDPFLCGNPRYLNHQDVMLRDLAVKHQIPLLDRPDFACGFGRKRTKTCAFYHP